MKIIKLAKSGDHYYALFDEIPELTYERKGFDYIGSATDEKGNIIASEHLKYESYGNAFAGREINLKMKSGKTITIKDHWFDHGSYPEHGEFMGIAAGTLEELQDCYVYFSYNINKETFERMVEEYLSKDRLYSYKEVRKWCNLQYKWYNVIVNGKQIPYMMNKCGDMVEKESKKRVYPRKNVIKNVNGKWKEYHYFKFQYMEDGKLNKIEANYLETLKATLPFSEEEIIEQCKIPVHVKKVQSANTKNDIQKIYQKAITTWGISNQIGMAIEEMGELLQAINKYYRGQYSEIEVCEEIADVQIMSEQLAMFFGESTVEQAKLAKIDRLEERLKNE